MTCRSCGAALAVLMADLGSLPLANDLRASSDDALAAPRYPLRVRVCGSCHLAQLDETVPPAQLFHDYAYFSSYSDTWLAHARAFADRARHDLALDDRSTVVEIASNDGYLLRWFADAGVRVLGVEPAANVAAAAEGIGVQTLVRFFDRATAAELRADGVEADLVVANNVVAHVPDPNQILGGIEVLLGDDGVATVEVPHLLRLIESGAFDTIYHEHYSYFSLLAFEDLAARNGLIVVDVEELTTHGGSLRLWLRRSSGHPAATARVAAVRAKEIAAGLADGAAFDSFAGLVRGRIADVVDFVDRCRHDGMRLVGYGAAAKATVLLNASGIEAAALPLVADRSPHKIGRFIPGVGTAVVHPTALADPAPDFVLVFPWNILDEIRGQLEPLVPSARLVTAVPRLEVHG